MRIVFMGTPDFAVPCLQRILADGHEVPAVFTQPDKPVGRHAVLTPPPVKQLAQERGIPVYQPTKMRDGTVAAQLKELAPDCLVVVYSAAGDTGCAAQGLYQYSRLPAAQIPGRRTHPVERHQRGEDHRGDQHVYGCRHGYRRYH